MSTLAQLTDANFDAETSTGLVLVDFWASWCGPCKMLAPILEEIADELGDAIKIVKVNAEEAPTLAKRFSVRNLPTMILLRDGEIVKQLGGINEKSSILNEIKGA